VGVYRADAITDEQVRRKYQGKSRHKYNTIQYNKILLNCIVPEGKFVRTVHKKHE